MLSKSINRKIQILYSFKKHGRVLFLNHHSSDNNGTRVSKYESFLMVSIVWRFNLSIKVTQRTYGWFLDPRANRKPSWLTLRVFVLFNSRPIYMHYNLPLMQLFQIVHRQHSLSSTELHFVLWMDQDWQYADLGRD